MKQMLSKAIALATKKHDGQFDKAGMPYILHCLKVMHYLKTDDEELMCIAVLHDIIEDTDVYYDDLLKQGMSVRVAEGVHALTNYQDLNPGDYLERILANKDAMVVKLCDLRHNMDVRRLKGISEKDAARLDKYAKMYTTIKEALNKPELPSKP